LQIAPAVYLRLKDLLIMEHMRLGRLTKEDAQLIAQDTPEIIIPIYEMLVSMGILISTEDWQQGLVEPVGTESGAADKSLK
jgi:hypothetical protein